MLTDAGGMRGYSDLLRGASPRGCQRYLMQVHISSVSQQPAFRFCYRQYARFEAEIVFWQRR